MAHAEKRSVSTDALETLGTIITEGAGRDAIHLAVEPVIAAELLPPGTDVGFVEGGVGITGCDKFLGIVDPFLKQPVQKGERFWLVLYPRQITSLRHVWSHPAFPESDLPPITDTDRENALRLAERMTHKSENWLRDFCAKSDCPSWDTVREIITSDGGVELGGEDYGKSYIDGDYIHLSGLDGHDEIPPEFWDHAERVTGKKFTERPSYFTCSC